MITSGACLECSADEMLVVGCAVPFHTSIGHEKRNHNVVGAKCFLKSAEEKDETGAMC